MKFTLVIILVTMIAWTFLKALMLNSTSAPVVFPTFQGPNVSFGTLPDSCGGFTDCIEYVGTIIKNMVLAVVYLVELVVLLLVYLFEIVALITTVGLQPIKGAPPWINALLFLPYVGALGIIIYTAIRKGDTAA